MLKKSQNLKNCKLIIFDLDGTLINSLPLHLKAMKILLQRHNIPIPKLFHLMMGKPAHQILKELKEKYNFPEKIQDLRIEKKEIFIKLSKNKIHPFPKIPETLKRLKKSYKIALATGSTKKEVASSVKKEFLAPFDFISTIEDVKRGKPSPKQLLFTAKSLHIPPSHCLVIGDSIFDAMAANKAKMLVIPVTSGFTPKSLLKKYHPLATLPSVNKLPNYLKK